MGLTFVPITLIATSGIPQTTQVSRQGSTRRPSRSAARSDAILATFAVSATEDTLAGVGGEQSFADQAQALVDGFHVAYAGVAILMAARAVLLLLVLRR